mgnify:CR=1 FL=1
MLSKRIIACLDVRDGCVVKGVNFEGLRNAGDPAELAIRYNQEGIDEVVILDVTATIEKRKALADTIHSVAQHIFLPLCVGGGIRDEHHVEAAIEAGADAVNDVTAMRGDTEMAKVIAEYQVPVILMFSKDSTSPTITLQSDYEDMLYTLKSFFRERLHFANSKGVLKIHIVLDQGMGVFQWCYKIQLYDHQENFKTA